MDWLTNADVTDWLYVCGGMILTIVLLIKMFVDALVYFFGDPN